MSVNKEENDDDIKSKGFTWMEGGKTLSKNLLYAPLEAYLQPRQEGDDVGDKVDHDPSQYMRRLSKVPKSLHESSFVNFMQSVSYDYHRNRATFADAKNNGSRPVSQSDMEDRIRQKAVTLMGGGINSYPRAATQQQTSKQRRRRKRPWETVQPILRASSAAIAAGGDDTDFLQRLNAAWNGYIIKVLDLSFSRDDLSIRNRNLTDLVSRKFAALRTTDVKAGTPAMELVGAHVRIDECRSRPAWVGRFGVLIEETTNTWRVAGCRRRKRCKRPSKKSSNDPESVVTCDHDDNSSVPQVDMADSSRTDHDKTVGTVDLYVVPKRGSSLMLIIPVPDVEVDGGTLPSPEHVDTESIIPLPNEAICVVLDA